MVGGSTDIVIIRRLRLEAHRNEFDGRDTPKGGRGRGGEGKGWLLNRIGYERMV